MPDNEASLRGRIAAHESWAKTEDRTARTAPARAALERKFLDAAGGDPTRAEHFKKADTSLIKTTSVTPVSPVVT